MIEEFENVYLGKKYLFYDNCVRGAGIGHLLRTYNYGLIQSIKSNLIFMPPRVDAGHGIGKTGNLELFLGLGDYEEERKIIEKSKPHEILYIPYNGNETNPTFVDFSLTKNYFRDKYKHKQGVTPTLFSVNKETTKISICIRRGEIAMNFPKDHYYRKRLLPDKYFVNVLQNVLEKYNIKQYEVIIFSDGNRKEGEYINDKNELVDIMRLFGDFNNVTYFSSSMDAVRTFTQFDNIIRSDIHIASITGFSEAAALYTDNLTIYPVGTPYCHNENCIKNVSREGTLK